MPRPPLSSRQKRKLTPQEKALLYMVEHGEAYYHEVQTDMPPIETIRFYKLV